MYIMCVHTYTQDAVYVIFDMLGFNSKKVSKWAKFEMLKFEMLKYIRML